MVYVENKSYSERIRYIAINNNIAYDSYLKLNYIMDEINPLSK